MTRIIFIRHGQSEANANGMVTGQLDFPLTELGRSQAEKAAEYLFFNEKIDRIYSSDLQRAVDTALPTAELFGLPISTDKRLREIDTGGFAGLTFLERDELYPEEVKRLKNDLSHMKYPDGEYVPDFYDRVKKCVCEIAIHHVGETVLIATHGGTIRVFDAFARGYSREEVGLSNSVDNASINIYESDGASAYVVKNNITEHLQITMK